MQGMLNNQYAVTIVVTMLISAFNALALSHALAALLLRPRQASRGLLSRFFGGFNRGFEQVMHGYVNGSHLLIRKAVVGMLIEGVSDLLIPRQMAPPKFVALDEETKHEIM